MKVRNHEQRMAWLYKELSREWHKATAVRVESSFWKYGLGLVASWEEAWGLAERERQIRKAYEAGKPGAKNKMIQLVIFRFREDDAANALDRFFYDVNKRLRNEDGEWGDLHGGQVHRLVDFIVEKAPSAQPESMAQSAESMNERGDLGDMIAGVERRLRLAAFADLLRKLDEGGCPWAGECQELLAIARDRLRELERAGNRLWGAGSAKPAPMGRTMPNMREPR